MPCYNAASWVSGAIRSVLAQSHQNWELIVVNDGSTDETAAIVKSFTDPRIKYLEQSNQGVSSARNAGLSFARGEYFCFLDADDELPPQSIFARLEIFQREDVDFVDGAVEIFDGNMSGRIGTWRPRIKGAVMRSLVRLDGKCFFGPSWMVSSKYRSSRFVTSLTHGEDLLFFLDLSANGKYSYTNEIVLKYRRSAGSAMGNLTALANGYSRLYKFIQNYRYPGAGFDKMQFILRSRKFMFLSFFNKGLPMKAFAFLVFGKVHG